MAEWKLVPVEPTQDMLSAMAECDGYLPGDRDRPTLTRWEDYWRMAISAAPQAPSGQQAEPTIKYVPINTNEYKRHPNDKEPRNDACEQELRDRGDSEGQGLDPFWKWAFRQGFNAALAAAPQATSGQQAEPAGQAVGEPIIINGEPATAHSMLAGLIDIYDDAQNNPPEYRCYVESAWPDALKEARRFLAASQAERPAVKEDNP